MNEEQIKQVLKLMGERFSGTKGEHQAVDAVVKMLCANLKINTPETEKVEEEKAE